MQPIKQPDLLPRIAFLAFGLGLAGLAPALAQDATPAPGSEPPVASLHVGTCEEPAMTPVADLGVLARLDAAGAQDAAAIRGVPPVGQPLLGTEVTLDLPFDDVFGQQPHVLGIHESAATFGTLLACGEVAGVERDGRVAIGLRPVGDTGHAGIAVLDDDDAGFLGLGQDQTRITVYLMSGLMTSPDGDAAVAPDDEAGTAPATPEAAATPVPTEEAAAAAEEDEAAVEVVTVEAVDIDFNPNEFSIPAETDAPVNLLNTGAIEHTFTIDELGIDEVLDPGEERGITINAEAGDYTFYCTVPGHREAGQEGTMTVE